MENINKANMIFHTTGKQTILLTPRIVATHKRTTVVMGKTSSTSSLVMRPQQWSHNSIHHLIANTSSRNPHTTTMAVKQEPTTRVKQQAGKNLFIQQDTTTQIFKELDTDNTAISLLIRIQT